MFNLFDLFILTLAVIIFLLLFFLKFLIDRTSVPLAKKRLYFAVIGAFFISPTILPAGIAGLILPSPLGFPVTIFFSYHFLAEAFVKTYTSFGMPNPDINATNLGLVAAGKLLWIWVLFLVGYFIAALSLYALSKLLFVSKQTKTS